MTTDRLEGDGENKEIKDGTLGQWQVQQPCCKFNLSTLNLFKSQIMYALRFILLFYFQN